LSSLLSPNIYESNTGIIDLIEGRDNIVPSVPKGLGLNTKSWKQESILRLILNYYDIFISRYFGKLPAYEYESLIDWNNFRKIIKAIVELESDESIFIFNNSLVSIFKTSYFSPKVININSKHKNFDESDNSSYQIYNNMLKNNYTRTGVQDLIDDNYNIFKDMAQTEYTENFDNRLMITSGFGDTGAAQAIAMNLNKGVSLVIDMDRKLIEKMVDDNFCNVMYEDIDSAIDMAIDAKRNSLSKTIGLIGNASEVLWSLIDKGIIPNLLTDRTNAYNTTAGYFPSGYSFSDSLRIRKADPHHYKNLVGHTIMTHVKAMIEFQKRGSRVFDFGNLITERAYNRGLDNAFSIESYVDKYIYPVISNNNKLNFKWFAISGDTEDTFLVDDMIVSAFKNNSDLSRMIDIVNKFIFPKNIPSRNAKLDKKVGLELYHEINKMIKNEELSSYIIANVSSFSSNKENDKFISEPSDIDISKLLKEYNGSTMVTVDYCGNKDQFFKMINKSLLLDGSKESEQNIQTLINF